MKSSDGRGIGQPPVHVSPGEMLREGDGEKEGKRKKRRSQGCSDRGKRDPETGNLVLSDVRETGIDV